MGLYPQQAHAAMLITTRRLLSQPDLAEESMKTYQPLILSLMSMLTIVGCGESGAQEDSKAPTPIQDKEDPQAHTKVQGLALHSDGTPAPNATIYMISKTSSQRLKTVTNVRGEFSWPEAFTGEATLVINNGQGLGHIEDIVVFAGGTLDVGTLTLAPLERYAQIVDIAQVGFEERVTREAGDYQYPVYNDDATKVYAVRRIQGQELWTLVEVDTSSGQELILKQDIALDTTEEEIGTLPLSLHHDRYVLYYDEDGPVLHDPVANKTIFSAKDHGLNSKLWWPALSNDKRILFFEPVTITPAENSFGGGRFRWRLRGYDWTQDKVIETPQLPTTDWLSQPIVYYNQQNKAVVGINPFITDDTGESPKDIKGVRTHIFAIDLDNLRSTLIARQPLRTILPQGQDKLLLSAFKNLEDTPGGGFKLYPSTMHTLDLNTMRLSPILLKDINTTTESNMMLGAVDPQGLHATYWELDDYWKESKLMQIDLTTKQSSQVDLSYEPGLDLDCIYRRCQVRYNHDGELQIFATLQRGDDTRGVFTQLSTPSKTTHEIDLQEGVREPRLWWNMLEDPLLKTKIFAWRVVETGFFQLYMDDPTSPQTAPVQRTFLPAHHEHFRLSQDGQLLYYFTIDPLSGHTQLFRLQLDQLPPSP